MRWRSVITTLASAGCTALVAGAMSASPAGAAAMSAAGPAGAATTARPAVVPSLPVGHFGPARQIPGLAALNAGGNARVAIVDCPVNLGAGNCTAVGTYWDAARHNQVFYANEVNGTWGQATTIPGLNALNTGGQALVQTLTYQGNGSYVLGGEYQDNENGIQPFVAESQNRAFGPPRNLFPADALHHQAVARVTSVACTAPGECVAAVSLPIDLPGGLIQPKPFLVTESNGSWGAAAPLAGIQTTNLPSEIFSLKCWAPMHCLAGGNFTSLSGHETAMYAFQSGGIWSAGIPLVGLTSPSVIGFGGDSSIMSVDCAGNGDCVAGGVYRDTTGGQQVFVGTLLNSPDADWVDQTIPSSAELNQGRFAVVNQITCGFPDDCAVAGTFDDVNHNPHEFVASSSGNVWHNAQQINPIFNSPNAEAGPMACGDQGSCLTGGEFHDPAGRQQAWVASSSGGNWGPGLEVAGDLNAGGVAAVNSASCRGAGDCGIGGFYKDAAGHFQGFVANASPVVTVALSTTGGNVAVGNESAEHVTVKVAGATGGTPTGTVDVVADTTAPAGNQLVCTITLANGTGDCTLPAGSLPPASYTLFAFYSGDGFYNRANTTGSGHAVNVLPATVATATSLAPATVTFGREQVKHVIVTVTAPGQAGDIPGGTVTMKAGSVPLGAVTLNGGTATLILGAAKLRPGRYTLTASYGGDLANNPSTAAATLVVAAEPTTTLLTLSAPSARSGHEQTEKLTVQVKPQTSGFPAGKVTIKAGSVTLCVITVKSAKGTCLLSASELRPGKYTLTASYAAASPYAGSTSVKKSLTVTK